MSLSLVLQCLLGTKRTMQEKQTALQFKLERDKVNKPVNRHLNNTIYRKQTQPSMFHDTVPKYKQREQSSFSFSSLLVILAMTKVCWITATRLEKLQQFGKRTMLCMATAHSNT